jgi:GTP pyrophosphokinase
MLGERFQSALVFAARKHARQKRKGTRVPYIAHLLAVTALVLEAGCNEDTAVAALLHDVVEDQGGYRALEEIRAKFGGRVAEMVAACTDSFETPKPPWRQRKEAYLAHLRELRDPDARLISLADKLHNARSTLEDMRREGISTLNRFKGGIAGTLWYYQSLTQIFMDSPWQPMAVELAEIVAQIHGLIQNEQQSPTRE